MLLSLPPQEPLDINVKSIKSQIAQLFHKQSPYEHQKSRFVDQLCQFLASLPMPKDLMSASPRDLVRFLVWKDKSGKTQVHAVGCPHCGLTCPSQCGCPHWLAAGSIDSLTGKLKTIFKENDRAGDWEERLGLGNPAASLLVRKYQQLLVLPQNRLPPYSWINWQGYWTTSIDSLKHPKPTRLRCISCPEIKPISKPCFSLGTDLETLARFAQMKSLGFPMMMGYSLTTHGENALWRRIESFWCKKMCKCQNLSCSSD